MGIVTDVNFVEGVIESLKGLGFSGSQFHIREVNCFADLADGGYVAMASRTGADIRDMSGSVSSLPSRVRPMDGCSQGTWFTKVPFLWPVNAPDTFLLNIAKFKTHGMGVTLCAKNLQGTIASGYVSHCTKYGTAMNIPSGHVHPTANAASCLTIIVTSRRESPDGTVRVLPEAYGRKHGRHAVSTTTPSQSRLCILLRAFMGATAISWTVRVRKVWRRTT